jgi:hypothetical protein
MVRWSCIDLIKFPQPVIKHSRKNYKTASQRRLQRKKPPHCIVGRVYSQVDLGGKEDNNITTQDPEGFAAAMSPTECQSACKDRYAHGVGHVLAH